MRALAVFPAPAYRWNFVVLGLDSALFTMAVTFTSTYGVLPLFVRHLTPSPVALGLIPAVVALGSYLPPILVAPALQRRRRRKPFPLAWSTVERLPFLALALLTPALAPTHPRALLWVFFALFALSMAAGGSSVPAWLDLLARVLPADWRGRFFRLWSAPGLLLGLGGGVATAALLRGRAWPSGFALCFGGAFVCMVVSFPFLARARGTPVRRAAGWTRGPCSGGIGALGQVRPRRPRYKHSLMPSDVATPCTSLSAFNKVPTRSCGKGSRREIGDPGIVGKRS